MCRPSIFLIPLALLIGYTSHAQDNAGDSLKKILMQAQEDTVKVNTLIELSKLFVGSAPDSTLAFATQAKELAARLQFVKGEAFALKYIGIYYNTQARNVETLDAWLQSLNLFRSIDFKWGIANMLSNIGALYDRQADDAKALEYYLQSLAITEQLNDKLRMATVLMNIGNTYIRKKTTLNKGVQYLQRALPLSIEVKNQDAIVTAYTNLGEGYFKLGKIDSSLYYYKKGLAASKSSEQVSTTFILNNIGKAYVAKGEYELAIRYQKQSVALGNKLNARAYIGKSILGLGDTYLAKGDLKNALAHYQEAEKILVSVHSVEELIDTYAGLTNIYAKLNDKSKAFYYQTKFAAYKDTLYNLETDRKLSSLQLDFDISKKESQITLLTKDQELKELELQKQKATRNGFAVGFLLILVTAFVIYRNYRIKVKTNIILDRQKVQIENLMLNILPAEVAAELQEKGQATPRHYDSVSVLFTDFKSFTSLSDKMAPEELIEELGESFMAFDEIVDRNQIEKIKTIGDSYMCAGGIPTPSESHVLNIVKAGLEMQAYVIERNKRRAKQGLPAWELRIGIHVGPVVAGVVGKKKYAYDIWGSTVNIASRMESNGEPGKVNISSAAYHLIKENYVCSHRGKISAKNVGEIDMYFVEQEISSPEVYSFQPDLGAPGYINPNIALS